MLVDIDIAVFDASENGPAFELIKMIAQHRHDWHPSPRQAIRAERFVNEVTTTLRIPALIEWAQMAVQESAYPVTPATEPVAVRPGNVKEIAEDLGHPAVLVVENKRADGGFIQTVATVLDGERIAAAIHRGWLKIGHGGGNSEMAWLVAEECRLFAQQARVAALLDFDNGPDSESNKQAEEIRRAGRAKVHVWSWRSVENYVPFAAWEYHLSRDRQKLRELEAVRRMPV